jgi:hypothetical protein
VDSDLLLLLPLLLADEDVYRDAVGVISIYDYENDRGPWPGDGGAMAKEISIGGGGAALFLCGDQTYRWKTILAGGRDGVDEQTTSTWKRFGGRLLDRLDSTRTTSTRQRFGGRDVVFVTRGR